MITTARRPLPAIATDENLLNHLLQHGLNTLAATTDEPQPDVQSQYLPPDFLSETCDEIEEDHIGRPCALCKGIKENHIIIKVLISFGSDNPMVTLVDTGSTFSLLDYEVALTRIPNCINLLEKNHNPTAGSGGRR